MNPDSLIVRNYKTKELAVRDYVLANFSTATWLSDASLTDACSLRRPDMTVDMGSHVVYVEIEEHGHDFGYTCGSKRLCQLWQDAGERSSVFVRFNPDSYTDEDGVKVSSCWKKNSQGFSVVKDADDWNTRLEALKLVVQFHMDYEPTKSITTTNLFFTKVSEEQLDAEGKVEGVEDV